MRDRRKTKKQPMKQERPADLLQPLADSEAPQSEQRPAEGERRLSTELVERIFSTTNLMIAYLDTDFNFIRVSRAYAAADGRESQFFLGKNHFDLYPNEEDETIFRRVVETGEPYTAYSKPFQYAEHPERGLTYWDWTLQPVKDLTGRLEGLLLALVDVTDRVKAEAELRRHRDDFKRLVEERTVELRAAVQELEKEIGGRERREKALQVSRRFLEIANRHSEMGSLLREFVAQVMDFSGCAAVGLRVLDEEGNIPYQAYEGFDRRFYESESPLSIKSDQCMCVNVVTGTTDPNVPFYTDGGSMYVNATTRFLSTVSEEEKGKTRNVCNQFGYESVALIPIRLGQRILGLIHVADSRENMVPVEMVEMLERAAMQLGTAMQRIWAEEELRNAHDTLERRVEERTADLAAANRQLREEIKERKRAEKELMASRQELRNLSAHLQAAREDERTRIAREIHDELGQVLTALRMDLSWLGKKLSSDQEPLLDKTRSMSELIDGTIRTVQRISTELRPGLLDDLGLAAAIEWQAGDFEDRTGIKCDVALSASDIPLSQELSTGFFRIFQEALTNIARHAEATRVKVTLNEEDGRLVLRVKDNGKGITEEQRSDTRSLGLIGMRERAHSLGGTLDIVGREGRGTTVTLSASLYYQGTTG